jgi:hypothetical protein
MSDNVFTLINYVSIVNWFAIGVATAGLIYLRKKMPPAQYPRPLQVRYTIQVNFYEKNKLIIDFK